LKRDFLFLLKSDIEVSKGGEIKMEKPWWRTLVWLFVAFVIAGAIKVIYQEISYKRKIPIENLTPEWQPLGSSTMVFEGEKYIGDVHFDRKSLEKKDKKVTLWVKITTKKPIVQRKGKETYKWNEQVARWIIDCDNKEVKMDYHVFYWDGKKQLSGKVDDLNLPIMKGTTVYTVYESLCF
jgi:hypothetical protein